MALTDPLAAYNARDSTEANFVCHLIQEAGMNAFVIEDVSNIGLAAWTGPMPELHKPQVWIERADADRVKSILDDYEQRAKQRREGAEETREASGAEMIQVVCEECGETLTFPAARRGTVEVCPQCGRHVDVDDLEDEDEWWLVGGEEGEQPD